MTGKLESITITALANGWLVSLSKRTTSKDRPWVQSRTAFESDDDNNGRAYLLNHVERMLDSLNE